MKRFCPLSMASDTLYDCKDSCIMYEDGCLFKKAVKLYIQSHTPFEIRKPTDEEAKHLMDILKKEMNKQPVGVLYKDNDLKVEHDYDEHGVDWYPHGYDDIAP